MAKTRTYARTKPAQVAEYTKLVEGAESQPRALQSIEEAAEEAIKDYLRKKEGEKWPWGPHVPIGHKKRKTREG